MFRVTNRPYNIVQIQIRTQLLDLQTNLPFSKVARTNTSRLEGRWCFRHGGDVSRCDGRRSKVIQTWFFWLNYTFGPRFL